jgi:cysteinyl-tRNA synthetase
VAGSVLISLLLAGCAAASDSSDSGMADTSARASRSPGLLSGVQSWLYLLDTDLEPSLVDLMADSGHDLVVLDFVPSQADRQDFDMRGVIERLHTAPRPKLVLAYLDIGQAEDYRTYWQSGWGPGDPDWIVGVDPEGWEGCFPVAYWDSAWRDIWLENDGYLQAVIEAGFDGMYLDWIEAYDDDKVRAQAEREGRDPEAEMVQWVRGLAERGRALVPRFIVVAQNAVELLEDEYYAAVLDGVAQEAIWFDGSEGGRQEGDVPTDAELTDEYLSYLEPAHARGLAVFAVDYARNAGNVNEAAANARERGFIPFVGGRGLASHEPPAP